MERLLDMDTFDEDALIAALPEDFQRQLRTWTHDRTAARRYFMGQAMGGFSVRACLLDLSATIEVTDVLTWDKIEILRDLVCRMGGIDYVVDSLEGRGELVADYGGDYVESYTEIHFKRKEA